MGRTALSRTAKTRKGIEKQNAISLLNMRRAPEHELLSHIDDFKPIIDWILYNFEDLKSEFKELYYLGKFLPEPGFKGNGFVSTIESQIVSLATCEIIVNSVDLTISGLINELIIVYNNRYFEKWTQEDTADFMKTSIRQVVNIESKIRERIIRDLDAEGITPSNLFWFHRKYKGKF